MPSGPAASDPRPEGQLPTLVRRPRLETRLDAVPSGGLGLLVASAGSGKSVLVRQWCASGPAQGVAALSISRRHDEDASVLAKDLVAAIRTVAPQVGADLADLAGTGGPALGETFVAELLRALAALRQDVVLVLEDVHALSNRSALNDLGRLVTALPRTTRAVVTTRRDLPWQLHRLRLGDGVVEIRGAELAFRQAEAKALLERVSQRELDDEEVRTLVDRTDGWGVGLQLAAISIRNAPDVASFVQSFAGTDQLVAEYLLNEVIEHQEPAMRHFLLHTSVLDWLSADVCAAVTGMDDASTMLDELYRRSMFLIPVDDTGATFRYHHLFAEVLRLRLRIEQPGAAVHLHHRAARWLLRQRREEEAIRHLLDAGDTDEAFRVISTVGHRLFERGDAATLVGWLSSIEEADADCPVSVQVNLLAAQLGADDTVPARDTYRRICRRRDLTLADRTAVNALYSLLVFRDLHPETVLEITDRVREAVPRLRPDDVVDFLGIGGLASVHTVGEYTAALAHFFSGDLERSAAAMEHVRTLPGTSYPLWHVYVLGSLALVRAWQGRATEAVGLAGSALEEAASFGITRHHASAHAHLALAVVYLDRLELDAAEQSLLEAGGQVRSRTRSVTYFDLQGALEARLAALREGPVAARTRLRSPAASSAEAPVLRDGRRAFRTLLHISTGDLPGARALLDAAADSPQLAPARIDLALAVGDASAAREVLDDWGPAPGDLRSVTRRLLREFRVLDAEGDRESADASLTRAVAVARGERLRWCFLEVPAALRAVRRGVVHAPWLSGAAIWEHAVRFEPSLRAENGLLEPFTEREVAVLAYLPSRMKNQEIAADLFVSVNTLKTHLGHIYRKLGVTERNEAIARASELGLL